MASTALGIVGTVAGTAIGGPLGGAIGGYVGALVGGLVDNMLFAGQQKVEGPRIDDLTISASSYGQPIPLLYGPQNRLAGNMIDKVNIRETVTTEESSAGGKGGPTVSTTTYSYDIPMLAFAFGEGVVNGIKRIWANGKLIFDIGNACPAPAAPTTLVGMVATRGNGTHAVFDTIRFYQGNGTQQIDPTLEAVHGVGNTPAYRHTSYCVITNLQLADFGNSQPNFEFEIEAHEEILVSTVCVDICARAGIDMVSTGGLAIPLKGYIVSRPGTAVAALEPLALVYAFDIGEQNGNIRCLRRGRAMRITIPLEDMGAIEGNAAGGRPEPVKFDRMDDVQLPSEAVLTFFDAERDYDVNSMPSFRNLGNSENKLSHEVSMTLSADEGRGVADRLLWEAWFARSKARFAVTDKYNRLRAGDIVGIPVANEVVPFKIERGTRGANGVIDLEARYEDPEVYRPIVPGDSGTFNPSLLELPGITEFQPLDMPIVRDVDDNTGFYWVVNAESTGWRGVEIKRSIDGGTTYFNMARTSQRAVTGNVATATPSGPARFWDRANVITVVLDREEDALESLSDELVLAGRNAAWIGSADGQSGEIIQFATATMVAARTYELSDLLRGRLGTEHAIGGHGASEIFVLLNINSLKRTVFGASDWNKERKYKPVSVLTDEADTVAQDFTNTGEGKRPYSPVLVRGERDSSDNLTLTWRRRSRLVAPGLGNGPTPLGEETEAYEIDILDGAAVVRTISATSETASYSAAQQTADGLTPGDPVDLIIYQLSAIRGRGRPKEATV